MFIFSKKLEKYIKHIIIPKVLLVPNKYDLKGSFRRKIPYVTDVDLVNYAENDITKDKIYARLINLINSLPANVTFLLLTCGTDNRFKLKDASDEELNNIMNLLSKSRKEELKMISEKYANDPVKRLFFANEIIWSLYKIRWNKEEVMANKKILPGNLEITLTDTIQTHGLMVIQYSVMVGNYPLGIDVAVYYSKDAGLDVYQNARDYHLKLSNFKGEYYYMLFPFRFYFKDKPELYRELNDLIEKKYGLYKQLTVRIDNYHLLYLTKVLDIKTATYIVLSILKDMKNLPDFKTNIEDKIIAVSKNNSPEVKISEWDVLLEILYDELNETVNTLSEKYFYKYLELIPQNERNRFIITESNKQ